MTNVLEGIEDVRLKGCKRVIVDDCAEVVVSSCRGTNVHGCILVACTNNLIRRFDSNHIVDVPTDSAEAQAE